MTDVAGYHGGDMGDEPPHRHPYKMPTSCESSKPSKRRAHGKNLNLYNKFEKNGSRPLPIEFDYSSNLYRAVGENYKLFIRGYENTERTKHNPSKGMDPEAWVQDNITDELNKAKSASGGDDTPVDEVEMLERSLGQRRGNVRGVGRTVKSINQDLPPHMYTPAANEFQQQLAEANARWAEQQRINEMMQKQINKLMSMQGGQGSSSPYFPGFQQNEDQDQDQDQDQDEDEDEDDDDESD
ncbi:hypothetical protein R6Q59_016307 [Mikania micrantha]